MKNNLLTNSVSLLTAATCLFLVACSDSNSPAPQASSHQEDHGHPHGPPHGGTPVLVAEHESHLELVRDPSTGLLQAYVLDDSMEDYIAVPETNFTLTARFDGRTEQVQLQRVPDSSGGNLSEPSSRFEGQAEWLKSASSFEAVIPSLTLRGKTFTNITFSFPKGTQHLH